MQVVNLKPFQKFIEAQRLAANESQVREAFIALAATGFEDDEIATSLALGAEYKVRFNAAGAIRRGAIDSYFGNLVIEFERDLTKTGEHAIEQLKAYVAGAWLEDGSPARPYLAVATDGMRWETYSPSLATESSPLEMEEVVFQNADSFTVPPGPDGPGALREFLNRLLFRRYLIKPTASNFARDFGLTSPTFLNVVERLATKLHELQADPELEVLRHAWAESLQIAYGGPVAEDELFLRHTYLVVLARLLVWTSLEHRALDSHELSDVLSGTYFVARHVGNLVEDDYFKWYEIPSETAAASAWIAMSRQLAGYDLDTVDEDILKPLYEQLVDPTMRHDLGEYYTPDWLATLVTNRLLDEWDWDGGTLPRLLDPTCGSGTFLRIAIDGIRSRIRQRIGTITVREIIEAVIGIDVHPLAVIIARATYLLAIRDLLAAATESVILPVYLADSLQMPPIAETPSLFGENVELDVGGTAYPVPIEFVRDSAIYDSCIAAVITVARSYGDPRSRIEDARLSLITTITPQLRDLPRSAEVQDALGAMAEHIARLIRARRDSIYGFLLRNQMRPTMLRHQFDFVLGNPPWLTVNDVVVPEYKQRLITLATKTKIASRAVGEQGHTDIATIMLAHAASDYLRDSPVKGLRIGLVMPRSIFTASQHRALRQGTYTVPFVISELWDLSEVTPLFNIPACVVFTKTGPPALAASPKVGREFTGRLRSRDLPWNQASASIKWADVQYQLAFLGKRSAFRATEVSAEPTTAKAPVVRNAYLDAFRQGAILYPQTLLVVRPAASVAVRKGVIVVHTDPDAASTAKRLKDVAVNRPIEARNLYSTAAADHIYPFVVASSLWWVILPTLVDPGDTGFRPVDAHALRRAGRTYAADWLDWAEEQWAIARKPGEEAQLNSRLDNLGHLSAQRAMKRFVVVYIAAGNRPIAGVIDNASLMLPFVARDGTYWTTTDDEREAHFLSAFLNSTHAADSIRDWMTLGLFGPRHIHKRVLDVPWPRFDSANPNHAEVAKLAQTLSAEGTKLMESMPSGRNGWQRLWLRSHLSGGTLSSLDSLVKAISSSA